MPLHPPEQPHGQPAIVVFAGGGFRMDFCHVLDGGKVPCCEQKAGRYPLPVRDHSVNDAVHSVEIFLIEFFSRTGQICQLSRKIGEL